jgi:hypothetical protein
MAQQKIVEGDWVFTNRLHKFYTVRKVLYKAFIIATGEPRLLYQPMLLARICVEFTMDDIYEAANEAAEQDQDFWTEFVLFFYKSTTDDEYQIFTCQKTIAQL